MGAGVEFDDWALGQAVAEHEKVSAGQSLSIAVGPTVEAEFPAEQALCLKVPWMGGGEVRYCGVPAEPDNWTSVYARDAGSLITPLAAGSFDALKAFGQQLHDRGVRLHELPVPVVCFGGDVRRHFQATHGRFLVGVAQEGARTVLLARLGTELAVVLLEGKRRTVLDIKAPLDLREVHVDRLCRLRRPTASRSPKPSGPPIQLSKATQAQHIRIVDGRPIDVGGGPSIPEVLWQCFSGLEHRARVLRVPGKRLKGKKHLWPLLKALYQRGVKGSFDLVGRTGEIITAIQEHDPTFNMTTEALADVLNRLRETKTCLVEREDEERIWEIHLMGLDDPRSALHRQLLAETPQAFRLDEDAANQVLSAASPTTASARASSRTSAPTTAKTNPSDRGAAPSTTTSTSDPGVASESSTTGGSAASTPTAATSPSDVGAAQASTATSASASSTTRATTHAADPEVVADAAVSECGRVSVVETGKAASAAPAEVEICECPRDNTPAPLAVVVLWGLTVAMGKVAVVTAHEQGVEAPKLAELDERATPQHQVLEVPEQDFEGMVVLDSAEPQGVPEVVAGEEKTEGAGQRLKPDGVPAQPAPIAVPLVAGPTRLWLPVVRVGLPSELAAVSALTVWPLRRGRAAVVELPARLRFPAVRVELLSEPLPTTTPLLTAWPLQQLHVAVMSCASRSWWPTRSTFGGLPIHKPVVLDLREDVELDHVGDDFICTTPATPRGRMVLGSLGPRGPPGQLR